MSVSKLTLTSFAALAAFIVTVAVWLGEPLALTAAAFFLAALGFTVAGVLLYILNGVHRTLRETKESGNALMENIPDVVIETGADGAVRSVNAAALRLTGYGEEELKGLTFAELVEGGSTGEAAAALERVAGGERIRGRELKLKSKDGTVRPAVFNAWRAQREGRVVCFFAGNASEAARLKEDLEKVRCEADEAMEKLKNAVKDIEAYSLMAVKRELKMQEIRESFKKLKGEKK